MKNFLLPDVRADSIYSIDFDYFKQCGIRGIILDIDNTLTAHDAPADEKSTELIKHLKDEGFTPVILSNNGEQRVKAFAEASGGIDYICNAEKPKTWAYKMAMNQAGLTKSEMMGIGDQIFTDVLGANLSGILSVLTKPLVPSSDTLLIRLKRILEKPLLFICDIKSIKNIS